MREYLPDICKCINLSHQKYKPSATDTKLIPSGMVEGLGDIRLLCAEVLFKLCKIDEFSQAESLNMIYDSAFHTLAIWAMKKCHNNIYMVEYTNFFVYFCRKANNLSLVNAILKTNLIADLANFFMENIFGVTQVSHHKEDYLCFFFDIVTAIKEIKQRPECASFNAELNKSLNWKYLEEILKGNNTDISTVISDIYQRKLIGLKSSKSKQGKTPANAQSVPSAISGPKTARGTADTGKDKLAKISEERSVPASTVGSLGGNKNKLGQSQVRLPNTARVSDKKQPTSTEKSAKVGSFKKGPETSTQLTAEASTKAEGVDLRPPRLPDINKTTIKTKDQDEVNDTSIINNKLSPEKRIAPGAGTEARHGGISKRGSMIIIDKQSRITSAHDYDKQASPLLYGDFIEQHDESVNLLSEESHSELLNITRDNNKTHVKKENIMRKIDKEARTGEQVHTNIDNSLQKYYKNSPQKVQMPTVVEHKRELKKEHSQSQHSTAATGQTSHKTIQVAGLKGQIFPAQSSPK